MDSKAVDRVLRGRLWPALRAAGFERRAGRTTWRDVPSGVQVVAVRSFNAYLAERMGATTASLSISLGMFFPAIAERSTTGAFVKDPSRPREEQCQLRRFLTKGLAQPNANGTDWSGAGTGGPAWRDRSDVWLVLPDGSNVDAVVEDATERVLTVGLPWLDAVSDPREAIRRFLEQPDVFGEPGILLEHYGGAIGSPGRWEKLGALAAELGDRALLARAVEAMSGQDFWRDDPRALRRLRDELAALD